MEYRVAVIVEVVWEDENDSEEIFRVVVDQQENRSQAEKLAARMAVIICTEED